MIWRISCVEKDAAIFYVDFTVEKRLSNVFAAPVSISLLVTYKNLSLNRFLEAKMILWH